MNNDKALIEILLQRFRRIKSLAQSADTVQLELQETEAIADESVRLIEKHQQEPAVDMNDLLLEIHEGM